MSESKEKRKYTRRKPGEPLKKRGPPKGQGGRKPRKWDEKEATWVKIMVSGGIELKQIADWLKMHLQTFNKVYKHEINTATTEINSKIMAKLADKAMKGDNAAMAFWLSNRGGKAWNPRMKVDHSNGDGTLKPVTIINQFVEAPEIPENER